MMCLPAVISELPVTHSFSGPLNTLLLLLDRFPVPLHLISAPHSSAQLDFLRTAFLTPQMSPGPQAHSHTTPCTYTSRRVSVDSYILICRIISRTSALPPTKSEQPVRSGSVSVLSQYHAWDTRSPTNICKTNKSTIE